MSDIVERLRTGTSGFITWEVKPIDLVAAAEIERLRAELQDWKAAYYADTKRIEAERDRLRDALTGAIESIEHWASYADAYFRDKHDLAGDLERARAALKESAHD